VEADDVDYMQPLDKENMSSEWSQYFLAPPFFQEATNEGGASSSGGGGMAQQNFGGKGQKGMDKGFGGMDMGFGGMPGMMMKGDPMSMAMMKGGGNTWYMSYVGGMQNLHGMQGHPGMAGAYAMPKRRGDGGGYGERTPTTAESDGGQEEADADDQELMMLHMGIDPSGRDQDLMNMHMGMDPSGWGQPAGAVGQPHWGGMPFYGAPGAFAPAPYGAGGYPGFFRGPMGHEDGESYWGPQ
jgi:hypothetical protein